MLRGTQTLIARPGKVGSRLSLRWTRGAKPAQSGRHSTFWVSEIQAETLHVVPICVAPPIASSTMAYATVHAAALRLLPCSHANMKTCKHEVAGVDPNFETTSSPIEFSEGGLVCRNGGLPGNLS